MDFANKQGILYVVIPGENELKLGKLMLKKMKTGKEYKIVKEKLAEFFKKTKGVEHEHKCFIF